MESKKRYFERNSLNTLRIRVIAALIVFLLFVLFANNAFHKEEKNINFDMSYLDFLQEAVVQNSSQSHPTQSSCTHYTCFDVYKCGHSPSGKISVYVYPITQYVDEDGVPVTKRMSIEFHKILQIIKKSEYYSSDGSQACILIPSIDMLNQNHVRRKEASKALASLP